MKRRLLSIFLTLTMILLMLPNVGIMSAVADDAPWDGSGTEQDPYQISSRDDFEAIADAVNGGNELRGVYFKQTRDIDMGGEADPWPTIGITVNNTVHQFRGVFDGGDRNIYGLYVKRYDDDAGLFGYVGEGGVIKNVHVKDGDVSGTYWVGGIAGRNYGLVEYCSFSGEVYGGQLYIGGIVGDNHGGTVSYCCNEGDVVFNQIGGGVVGRNSGGTVENCYNRGYVCSENIVRGYAGGVVGENTAESTVDNCYSDGWVESNGNLACGAVVGANGEGSTVKNCYYPEEFEEDGLSGVGSGFGTIENVTPKSEEQFDSGEVAWELSQGTNGDGWGQTLKDENDNHDKHPHFTQAPDKDYATTPIYRVLFKANDPNVYPDLTAAYYVDPGDDVELPKLLLPDAAWFVDDEENGYSEFNGEDIQHDYKVFAGKRILFAAENGTIVHRLTYTPEEQTVDLDMYLKYAEGGPYSEGRFDYKITADVNGLNAELKDEKYLIIPAGTNVRDGGYTLNITATEKKPYIMPLALVPIEQKSVPMEINIVIEKATPVIVGLAATDIVYGTTLSGSTLSGSAEHPTAGEVVDGALTWDDGSVKPTVNEAATTGYYVTFTPAAGYDVNYDHVTVMATVKVNKAPSRIVTPPEKIDCIYNGEADPLIDDTRAAADGGTIKYWLSPLDDLDAEPPTDNSAYSSTIPSRANAGTYKIWYKVIGDENHEDFQDANCYKIAVIGKRALTIDKTTVIYNGEDTFTLELPGVTVRDDDRIVFAKLTANGKNIGTYVYTTADEPGAGQYTVTLSDSNYEVSSAGDLVIEPRPVVLKWKGPLTFVKDNLTHTVEAEVTNGVAGDKLTLQYQEGSGYTHSQSAAGPYTAKVIGVGNTNYTADPDKSAQNVEQPWRIFEEDPNITLSASPNCTVQNRPVTYGDKLTLTADITKVGNESAPGSVDFYVNGFRAGSAPVVKQSDGKFRAVLEIANATAIIKDAPDGNEIFFSLGANVVRADYIDNGDEQVDAVTVFVEPKPLQVKITGETDQIYDGNDMASGLGIELLNKEPDDEVEITADSFTYNSKLAGKANTVTANHVMLSGAQSGNYVIKGNVTEPGHILPKPIMLEWRGVSNLIYTGDVPNVTATATETIPGDECGVTVRTDNKADAGVHEAEATGLSNSNYRLPDDKKVTYNIGKADLYIKSQTIRYNGNKTLTATADGVTTKRNVTEKVSVDIAASSPDVGDYTYLNAGAVGGADENTYTATLKTPNYTIAGGAILTIVKADPTYKPPTPNMPVYNGLQQDLVTAGEVKGGTMQYSFSKDGTYYNELPTGIGEEGNTVTIRVWYRIAGAPNYNDIDDPVPDFVDVTIYAHEDDVPKNPPSSSPSWDWGSTSSKPNAPELSDSDTSDGDTSDDPNVSDVSDSDTTKQPDSSSDGSSDNPHTGAGINLALYFMIMCGCAAAVAGISRKAG